MTFPLTMVAMHHHSEDKNCTHFLCPLELLQNFVILPGATVELSDLEVSVSEGNQGFTNVNICARLTDVQEGLERDVVLLLNSVDDTAGDLISNSDLYKKQQFRILVETEIFLSANRHPLYYEVLEVR